mgnify:CR=1 FL=1
MTADRIYYSLATKTILLALIKNGLGKNLLKLCNHVYGKTELLALIKSWLATKSSCARSRNPCLNNSGKKHKSRLL